MTLLSDKNRLFFKNLYFIFYYQKKKENKKLFAILNLKILYLREKKIKFLLIPAT